MYAGTVLFYAHRLTLLNIEPRLVTLLNNLTIGRHNNAA